MPILTATGPGAMLVRGREAKRLSVEEVAGRLKFAPRQIEALEADDYAQLPGTTFVRGMIRGYARLLGADAQPMLHAYEQHQAQPSVAQEVAETRIQTRVPFPDGRTRSSHVYVVLSAVMVVTMAAVVYEWQFGLPSALSPSWVPRPPAAGSASLDVTPLSPAPEAQFGDAAASQAAPTPSPQPAAAQAVPQGTAQAMGTAVPMAAGADRLVFDFGQESWVEVKDRGGNTLLSQLNPSGSSKVVEGKPPFSVVIGNASQVRLQYNDAPVDLTPHIKVEVARMTLK